MLINANRERTAVMEGLSDSDAVLSPMTEVGKKGLGRKSLRPWYKSKEVSVKPMGSDWTKIPIRRIPCGAEYLGSRIPAVHSHWLGKAQEKCGLGVDTAVDEEVRLTVKHASCSKFSQRSEQ